MDKAALLAAKLRGLARAAGVDDLQTVVFPGGAAALARASDGGGSSLWVLAGDLGARALGPALALMLRHRANSVDLLVDDPADATTAARRGSLFAVPVTVHEIRGARLEAVGGFSGLARDPLKPPVAGSWVETIERAGADAVFEHGILRAEVRGLEIGRVEEIDGEDRLSVGVGRHDREAHRMAHDTADPVVALATLVRQITVDRRAGAPSGLATDLARERWLRWIACRQPELVGARRLTPVDPPDERTDLRMVSIAPAVGETVDGAGAVFAFSVGIDPNLVPAAADVDPTRELVLVVPEGDETGITTNLTGLLKQPARIRTVPVDWPAMGD